MYDLSKILFVKHINIIMGQIMRGKEEFLQKYKISAEQFKAAEISWETLERIHDDFSSPERQEEYQEIAKKLSKEIFEKPQNIGLHSVFWRIKDSEHLIAKIIRKRSDNYSKYKNIDESNYWKIVRDLVGFRGLTAFKDEWCLVDKYINGKFCNDQRWYIPEDDYTKFDRRGQYLAEPTKAFIREGDNKESYVSRLGSENIIIRKNYRSVHYILKYHGKCVEFQVRTLFEEALAEMDHRVRYPNYISNEKLNHFSGMLNQLVGLADELGAYYMELLKEIEKNSEAKQPEKVMELSAGREPYGTEPLKEEKKTDTPKDCLDNILRR